MPTDTAIKSKVKLSKSAIILIKEDVYNSLCEDKIFFNFYKKFSCSLDKIVKDTLDNSDRFHSEGLTLTRSKGGYFSSFTSEETKRVINETAISYNIPQVLYYDFLTNDNSTNSDYNKSLIVTNYYLEKFYNYLFSNIECSSLNFFHS